MLATKDNIGKHVTFKLRYCRWQARKEVRIIHGVREDGSVLVTCYGYSKCFVVHPHEIIAIEREA